jgi:hypothetical protein
LTIGHAPALRQRSGVSPLDSAVYDTFIFERKEHYVDSKRG